MIFRRMGLGDGLTDHSDEDHDCFGKFSNTFASEGSPIFYRHSVVYFQEQQVLF